jgi:hypothetical protein
MNILPNVNVSLRAFNPQIPPLEICLKKGQKVVGAKLFMVALLIIVQINHP